MARNLDLTALRSFVAVADSGGVTRAAGFLNLTQSAVSMQLKRLEESLDANLLDRSARQIALTPAGEKLLGYARRMLELNDEVWSRLTDDVYEGEIVLGVPHDIVYPAIPRVLQQFNVEYPRMRVQLISLYTKGLKVSFSRGECDLILTTEDGVSDGGETLKTLPLLWIGAPGGAAWRQRPLRLAFGRHCIFRAGVIRRVEEAGIPWELAVESEMDRAIEATVSADLALNAMLEGTEPPHLERVQHKGTLPELASKKINMYLSDNMRGEAGRRLADLLRQGYAQM
ncbi:LysR family transcriptional regulator [Donghicola sp. C2-DW-16]|uniref:LysR family transcriptional regulator n=1 Tax=Donghicola mangrovi TaxID=2729614 RepID=A0A850QBU6_9RHOB|nr:LysR family transcriptional regulator [Donghicola mangrovi]NVO23381.1 LysR family transcriptional regulator [Donghicola mangrovi]NVO27161.1 LysR family transcriptional regulator [Donghicola mangrovi]